MQTELFRQHARSRVHTMTYNTYVIVYSSFILRYYFKIMIFYKKKK